MNSLKRFLTKAFAAVSLPVRSNNPSASVKSAIVTIIVLGIWLTVVIFTESRHEFWRDEVRALSSARAAHSPLDLYPLTKEDGHPVLWYLLLFIGKSIVDTPLVLPIASILIAFAAVSVFMFFSPFPFWIRCLFIFGGLPLYEYSVMARNYGISMLLLFVGAVLYRNRSKYPIWLAVVLALLANTNVHSVIFVCLIAGLWVWDTAVEKRTGSLQGEKLPLYLPIAIVIVGVSLCVAWTLPVENTILTPVRHGVGLGDLANSMIAAVFRPDRTFSLIVPAVLPAWVSVVLIYLAAFGLLYRPALFLAALGGLIAFGVLFQLVFPGLYRHQGLYLVFLMFLYWLFIDSLNEESMTRTKRVLFNLGLYGAMVILILGNVIYSKNAVWADIRFERSSSKAFGEFLNHSEMYRDAIIVPEPDYLVESLPYYAKNKIYFPREHRFGTTVSWTTKSKSHLSIGELLATAREIKTQYRQPVLIVFGHLQFFRVKSRPGAGHYSYNKVFSWNNDEVRDFDNSTILVREFKSAYTDENYRVYAIK